MRLVLGLIVMALSTVIATSLLFVIRIFGRHPRIGAKMTHRWARVMLWGFGILNLVKLEINFVNFEIVNVFSHEGINNCICTEVEIHDKSDDKTGNKEDCEVNQKSRK